MPMTATPAATDIPMIEPVESPPPSSLSLGCAVLEEEEVGVRDGVKVMVTVDPSSATDSVTIGVA